MQIKMKEVTTGTTIEDRFASDNDLEVVDMDRREMEYLYSDNTGFVFMDTESFDQITMHKEMVGEVMKFLKPNTKIIGLVSEEKVVSIELPKTVDLKVTSTPPGIKGSTATNQLKEATLETGLKTRVPGFINEGEMIRVSTEDGSYMCGV